MVGKRVNVGMNVHMSGVVCSECLYGKFSYLIALNVYPKFSKVSM
jgi:hypothetical protein